MQITVTSGVWSEGQIGNTSTATFNYGNGVFTIGAVSGGLAGTSDAGAFAYQPLAGDGTIVARITSVTNDYPWSRMGVMLRGGTQPTDDYAFMGLGNNANEAVFQTRTTIGTNDAESDGPTVGMPLWVKLVRSGGQVTGYFSGDGVNWTQQGSSTAFSETTLYAGLIMSQNRGCCGVTTATFDNVVVSTYPDFYLTNLPTTWVSSAAGDTSSFAVGVGALNGFTGSVSLSVTGLPANSTWSATPSSFSGSGTGLLTVTVPAGTAAGSYPVSVSATGGAVTHMVTATLFVASGALGALPQSWTAAAFGNTSTANESYANGVFTIGAVSGALTGNWDSAAFAYQPVTGDGSIVARITSVNNDYNWTRMGVMIRAGGQPSDPYAFAGLGNDANQVVFQSRAAVGTDDVESDGPTAGMPLWVKLVRASGVVTGYFSGNGVDWTQLGSPVTLPGGTIYTGLAVSQNRGCCGVTTATFDNVSVADTNGSGNQDFSINAPQATQTADAGSSVAVAIGVVTQGSPAAPITFSVTGLPSGATGTFSPATLSGSATATLTINTGTAATGVYALTVTGTSGTLTHSASLALSIQEDPSQPPAATSVSPTQGSGLSQAFAFVGTDAVSAADLDWMEVLINGSIEGNSACYLHYDRASNTIYLRDDATPTWVASAVLGASATLQNSQCSLNVAASTATAAGLTLTLNLSLSFSLGFEGTQNTYLLVDSNGVNSGRDQVGTWTVPAPAGSLPTGWTTSAIGSTSTANESYSDGVFTMGAISNGLSGGWDAGAFAYQPLAGDGTIVARITSVTNDYPWSRMGVMLRGGTQPTDDYAFMGLGNNANEAVFQTRTTIGTNDAESDGPTVGMPLWVKLVRSGGQVTGYFSGDGVNWTQQGSSTAFSETTLYAGLIMSQNRGCCGVTTATFDNVVVQEAAPRFSVPGGLYGSPQMVTIVPNMGATIRYTTDGSVPTPTTGTIYSAPVPVSTTTTVRAIAYQPGFPNSMVASATYTFGAGPAWYDTSWKYRKQITISHTQVAGSSALSDFPVLVSTTDPGLMSQANGGGVGNSDGSDVVFTAADGVTKLAHEVETYNGATGQTIAWVGLPSLSPATDTVLYAYYGNAGSLNQQNAGGVWDSNFKGVWHFSTSATLSAIDSTGKDSGTIGGSPSVAAGQVGWAANFSHGNDDIAVPTIPLNGADYTVSAWFQTPLPFNNGWNTLTRGAAGDHQVIVNQSNWHLGAYDNQASAFEDSGFAVNTLSPGWHYLVAAGQGASTLYYIDAAFVGSIGFKSTADISYLGNYQGGGQPWGGADELRVSTGLARPASWISTEYNNQENPLSFLTIGTAQGINGASAATPTFSLPSAAYSSAQSVTISSSPGAAIRYTTDGSLPTPTSGTIYSSPVTIGASTTINAIAYAPGVPNSRASASYTIYSGTTWYNALWLHRKTVTVSHAQVSGSSDLASFPLLYSVTDPNLKSAANGGSVGRPDGSDVLFTAADGVTKLNHEIESYNPATGQLVAWVGLPTLSHSTDTGLFIYYGNAAASNQQNPAGVWDSNFAAVIHFPSTTSLSGSDSTSLGNGLANSGAGAGVGMVGGAAVTAANNAYLYRSNPSGFQTGSGPRTVEGWFRKTDGVGTTGEGIFGYGSNTTNGDRFSAYATPSVTGLETENDGRAFSWTNDGQWHQMVAVLPSGGSTTADVLVYFDGSLQTAAAGGSLTVNTSNADFTVGTIAGARGNGGFNGLVDEVRVSTIARSAGWVATQYANQFSPATFFSIGGQQ